MKATYGSRGGTAPQQNKLHNTQTNLPLADKNKAQVGSRSQRLSFVQRCCFINKPMVLLHVGLFSRFFECSCDGLDFASILLTVFNFDRLVMCS
jgi:hypothetical protein